MARGTVKTIGEQWPAQEIVMRPVDALVPYARNSRLHSDEQVAQLARSIEEWGWTMPVLIDESDMLIAGHGRVMAAKLLDIPSIPAMVARDWSDEKKAAYVIADNKLAENASWDDEVLRAELAALQDAGFDVDAIGFSGDELDKLFAVGTEGNTDPDAAPPSPEEPVSAEGDIWILGNHRIRCGSSIDPESVDALLGGAEPHLMVTDPPYGVDYDPSWRVKAGIGGAGTATGVVLNDHEADWREAWALFPGKVAYVWHGGLHSATVMDSLAAEGFEIRAQIIWAKPRFALSRGHYHWQHEPAWFAVRPQDGDARGVMQEAIEFFDSDPAELEMSKVLEWVEQWAERTKLALLHYSTPFAIDHETGTYAVREGDSAEWQGDRKQSTLWHIEHIKSDTGHGTQKPIECMKRPILNNSMPGQEVYEPFSGSGTTIIACEMTGRRCFAMELSRHMSMWPSGDGRTSPAGRPSSRRAARHSRPSRTSGWACNEKGEAGASPFLIGQRRDRQRFFFRDCVVFVLVSTSVSSPSATRSTGAFWP